MSFIGGTVRFQGTPVEKDRSKLWSVNAFNGCTFGEMLPD